MKGKSLEELLNKRIKVITFSQHEYIGLVIGYVTAEDNEPEEEEISIKNEKDTKVYSLFENEIKKLEILKNVEK